MRETWQQVLAIRQRREDEALLVLGRLRQRREEVRGQLERALRAAQSLSAQRAALLSTQRSRLAHELGVPMDPRRMGEFGRALQSLSHKVCTLLIWQAHLGMEMQKAQKDMDIGLADYRRAWTDRQRGERGLEALKDSMRCAAERRAEGDAEEQVLQAWSRHA